MSSIQGNWDEGWQIPRIVQGQGHKRLALGFCPNHGGALREGHLGAIQRLENMNMLRVFVFLP